MLEHSSLFYTFNYTGSYFTTTSQDVVVISFNSQFYVLLPVLTYSYHTTLNKMVMNQISFWSNIYNSSVSSQIGTQNVIQYPSNQQIIILNDFLNIQLNNQSYNVSDSHVILTTDNITFSGQIGWFNISCQSKSQITNILNEIQLTNFNCDLLITVFNQTILCLNWQYYYYNHTYKFNYYLQIKNINPEGKLINQSNTINMTNITNYHDNISFSMNAQYIFFVCQNQDSQSQIVNDLFRINITNQSQLGDMTNLTRLNISYVNNQILQDDILYIYDNYLIIIYYTSLNITQSILTLCYMIDFQPFVFQKSNYSFYGLIYACQDNEHLYYLLGKQQQQENSTIQFIFTKHLQIQNYYYFDSSIIGILIVSQQINQIAIMCFINQFSIIIKLDYLVNEKDFVNSTLIYKRLLYLTPPFITNIQYQYVDAVISSGLVFVTYSNNNIYAFELIFYNISGLHTNFRNLDYTILPSGTLQFYQSLNILTFNSSYGFLLGYPNYKISSLKIDIYLQNTTDQCNLTASNLMNTLNANYTFNFKSQIDFGFEYALLAFLIIFFIAAATLFWYRTRDQKEQFGLEEFEGFEIDTFE